MGVSEAFRGLQELRGELKVSSRFKPFQEFSGVPWKLQRVAK